MHWQSHSPSSASPTHGAAESAIVVSDPPTAAWTRHIRAEYLEISGLHLTKCQVQRLWGLGPVTCQAIFAALRDVKFPKRTHRGTWRAQKG
jgi:hypothetical protein